MEIQVYATEPLPVLVHADHLTFVMTLHMDDGKNNNL